MKETLGLSDEAAFVPHILRHEFCSRLADRAGLGNLNRAISGFSA